MPTNDRIWAINELEEEYAPGFIERNLGDHIVLNQRIGWNSMNVYGIPNGYLSEKVLESGDIIRNKQGVAVIQQVYEELGSPDTTSTEAFLNVLRSVKEKYPDMIPAQASGTLPRMRTATFGLSSSSFRCLIWGAGTTSLTENT